MNTTFRKLIIASGVALALGATSGAATEDSPSGNPSDIRLEERISTTYALDPHLQEGDITVSVEDGKATLTGTVPEDIHKEMAEQFARNVEGVTEVDNQLIVDAEYVPPETTDSPGFGERIADATITAAVKSRLMWSRHAEGLATDVSTASGHVTLEGTAESEEASELAERLAMTTTGVISVENRLEIRDPDTAEAPDTDDGPVAGPRETASDTGDYISDTWITTKVRSTFIWSSGVSARDISVSTEDGIVTLSGEVDSEAEHQMAIELAEQLRGVRRVDASGLTF
ncbi:BON domain-containing protein [Thioalkalivibrio sp. ALR17-21]|uniref:BON domain-containing protein n=1 Tax=Thioalkalivibrio sp. ALR17-21 TaxID=1269813 RepID=UPI000415963A|nr:BON domain-containing protein [Thioalkalivibrio sp. ALR17-21]